MRTYAVSGASTASLPGFRPRMAEVLLACTEGRLASVDVQWKREASCCVVACGENYPQSSSKGEIITIDAAKILAHTFVFHAGTKVDAGKLSTNGGRILCVTSIAPAISDAIDGAYEGLAHVSFKDMAFRKDIARRAGAACLSR